MKYLIIPYIAFTLISKCSAAEAHPATVTEKVPLPSGSLIERMPNPSAWRISYLYDSERKNTDTTKSENISHIQNSSGLREAIRNITVSRSGEVWVAISEDVKGHKLEQCASGSQMFSSDPRHPDITDVIYSDGDVTGNFANFGRGTFPDLEWVSASTYLGVQNYQGSEHLVFAKEDGTKAWVNAKTRFPVQVKMLDRTITYERLPDPPSKLALPDGAARLKAAIDHDAAVANKSVSRDK